MKINASVIEKLTYREEGIVQMKPCLDVAFYWSGPVFERANGVVEFYKTALNTIGNGCAYFRTETMRRSAALKKDTLGLLPFWLQKTTTRRDIYALSLESGSTADEPSDRAFAFGANPRCGYVRLVLPVAHIAEAVASYLELAKRLGQMFSYDFGSAGYSVNWNHLGENANGVLRKMHSLANRYPGVDMAHPFTTKYIPPKGIKCVNWLTFLSKDYCDRLGGVALKKGLPDGIAIHDAYNGGLIIQAGPSPEIGDVNRRNNLPAYHKVGKVLSRIRSKEQPVIFGPKGIGDKEATDKWLSRFDS